GETGRVGSPKRREIGHGRLAKRSVINVLPTGEEFAYSMRLVSEITESNGSSSMASVCGASLALMDAGVPTKAHVAGIAMGLIKEGNRFAVLTDILGDEDHLGDMDFKVAGTERGVTALQMDIEIQDDGSVTIASVNADACNAARKRIEAITAEVEVGKIYEGPVLRLLDFGAIVQLIPGKDGLLHISQIAKERVNQVSDYLKEGQVVRVKVLEADEKGRVRLSMKAAAEDDAKQAAVPATESTPTI